MAPALLTIRETADALRISTATTNRLIRKGELRALKIGGSVRIPAAELARLTDVARVPAA